MPGFVPLPTPRDDVSSGPDSARPPAALRMRNAVRRIAARVWRSVPLQLALFFLPLVWISYVAITASERTAALQQARSHGDSVAKLFQENTERIFERVDQSILILRALHAQDPAGFDLKSWAEKARLASGDVVQFSLIGLDGYLLATTADYSGPPLYLGDREHFIEALAQADDRLYVAKPVLGRASNKWTIQLARKLLDANRLPVGVVVGSISVDVVGNFYETARLGTGGTLVLRNASYVVLAARGIDQNGFLGQVTGSRIQNLLPDGSGQYWSEGRADRSNRLITVRRSSLFPLIFTVGIAEQEIYARYRPRRDAYLAGAFLLTLVIVVATALYSRRQAALDRTQAELRASLGKFEDALRNMPQGFSMFDGNDRLVAFNRQWLDIYGLAPADVRLGMSFHDVFAHQTAVTDVGAYLRDLKDRLSQSEQTSNTLTFPDGRFVYISYGRRQGGGWVAIHQDITERKASEDRIEKLAHYDSLTGLANRNLFKERIDEALARHRRLNTPFAVLLFDLDKFKSVNDALGHQSGDALLQQVADRIRAEIREVDTAARMGGDEFALIVTPGQGPIKDGAAILASRLVEAIAAPYDIDGHTVVIGCSIGVAVVPDHGMRIDEILRNADLALYKSKNAGRNCFNLYSPDLKLEADRRSLLEIELREAIWREEIDVFYQPIVELATGRTVSVEALARWRHPARGFVPPAEFIPLAEEAGLIVELGNLVLAKACRDAMKMPDDVRIAVNLSAVQFTKSNLVDVVKSALAESGLPERRLELEITESVFLADSEENLKTLQFLKALGVSIALDDFGVGYSALSYLTAFPFDKVKVDKTFMDRIDRTETVAVLGSIVQLVRTLNLSIVAEGVETREQMDKIRGLGIPLGQGYLFRKPVPLADIAWRSPFAEWQAVA